MCERKRLAERHFGADTARRLRARVADLKAAVTATDLVAGTPTFVDAGGGSIEISLGEGSSLRLRVNHLQAPLNKDGRLIWKNVSRVRVVAIEVPDEELCIRS